MNTNIADAALWLTTFIGSTVCHEAAHAWSALKLGDATAYRGGQVSFNPWPHIRREPLGMVVVPLLSWFTGGYVIGWASAPYDPEWARAHPKRLALMSLAGPLANLALAASSLLLLRLGVEWQFFHSTSWISADALVASSNPDYEPFAKLLSVVFSLNLFLCVFNLLPLPPLDGSTVVMLFLPETWARKYQELLASPILRIVGLLVLMRGISFSMEPFYRAGTRLLFGNF